MVADVLKNAGGYALSAAVQFFAGILLSLPVYKFIAKRSAVVWNHYLLTGLIFAFLGVILPLGPFGILPLALAALCAGLPLKVVVPLSASNCIFNMLIPFTEISFNADFAWLRILAAIASGAISYFVLAAVFKNGSRFVRKAITDKFRIAYEKSSLVSLYGVMVNEIGLFFAAGVLLNALKDYYYPDAMAVFFNSGGGTAIRDFLLGRNAETSPFFITSASIFYTVTDITIPAALLCFLKLRGVFLLYVIIACFCALLLSPFLF